MSVIDIRDAGVTIAGRPIVRHLNVRVEPGEVVAVLGENGSGKSTLVKALLGLIPISSGHIALFECDLADFDQWARIGYVPQRQAAAGGVPATVWEVVASGRLSRRGLLRPLGRSGTRAISRALATVDLSERARDRFDTLSGGQQQRALIARALASEPELLVLDEPNAGVDTANQDALAESISRLVEEGATVVVVLHELGPLAPLITRTVVIHDGIIGYDGPPLGSDPDGHVTSGHHHHAMTATPRPVPPLQAPLDGRTP